jgi:oligoendopeptidase F
MYSDKIYIYKSFFQSIDPTNEEIAIIDEKDNNLYSRYEQGTSFFNVEIKDFDNEKIDQLLNNPDFSDYKKIFRDLKNTKKHILSQEAEDVIAKF